MPQAAPRGRPRGGVEPRVAEVWKVRARSPVSPRSSMARSGTPASSDLPQLVEDSLGADPGEGAPTREGRSLEEALRGAEVEAREEACHAQEPEAVLLEALLRPPHGPQDPILEVAATAHRVQEAPRQRVEVQGVHRGSPCARRPPRAS